jgi:hypothetical protein
LLFPASPRRSFDPITIVVRSRPDGPPWPGTDYWHRIPPAQRKPLSIEMMAQLYGAAPDDVGAVSGFVSGCGMTVGEINVAGCVFAVSGTVRQMNAAFVIGMKQYDLPLPTSRHRPLAGRRANEPLTEGIPRLETSERIAGRCPITRIIGAWRSPHGPAACKRLPGARATQRKDCPQPQLGTA